MDERDEFAVWLAAAVLRVNDHAIHAEALKAAAAQAQTKEELDQRLRADAPGARRPGDVGLEIVGVLLPGLLVQFARLLWDAYAEALAKQGGGALASATVDAIKEQVRRTWAGRPDTISLAEAEQRLRTAAERAGLGAADTDALVASLRKPALAQAVGAAA